MARVEIRGFRHQKILDVFVAGMQSFYNYIRPHSGIKGMTPAQMANIPINLMGNRWETMMGWQQQNNLKP